MRFFKRSVEGLSSPQHHHISRRNGTLWTALFSVPACPNHPTHTPQPTSISIPHNRFHVVQAHIRPGIHPRTVCKPLLRTPPPFTHTCTYIRIARPRPLPSTRGHLAPPFASGLRSTSGGPAGGMACDHESPCAMGYGRDSSVVEGAARPGTAALPACTCTCCAVATLRPSAREKNCLRHSARTWRGRGRHGRRSGGRGRMRAGRPQDTTGTWPPGCCSGRAAVGEAGERTRGLPQARFCQSHARQTQRGLQDTEHWQLAGAAAEPPAARPCTQHSGRYAP